MFQPGGFVRGDGEVIGEGVGDAAAAEFPVEIRHAGLEETDGEDSAVHVVEGGPHDGAPQPLVAKVGVRHDARQRQHVQRTLRRVDASRQKAACGDDLPVAADEKHAISWEEQQ